MLRTVITEGGFAQAAKALHRSQSSVSYAVGRLQEALGVRLLEIRGRRAVLTDAGATLLGEASPLIDELSRLEDRTRALAAGEDLRIRLLVDSIFPRPSLFAALKAFAGMHPHVEVHLRETVRLTPRDVDGDAFDLAVLIAEPGERGATIVSNVPLIAVAHADHPLVRPETPPNAANLNRCLRVEIRGTEQGQLDDNGKIWWMSTVEAAIEAVRAGLCYGWLPRHLVREHLDSGTLVALPLERGGTRNIPLGLLFGNGHRGRGQAVERLARLLAAEDTGSPPGDGEAG
ncbi:HTH-type transcriptional activator AllS [wastewater metagenome]|uniref:HTH-type transcriptional activator AllS n=2 Tax=unclassified sequences TaxID=12908 RepID=A0A5B8RCP1_9ZZZZ|nr:LysR family transcriptional regulator [Arhodomonas sp. KWT]QEA05182.1 HTH-type transcriptional activator AllS [uncultured organism]